MKELPVYSEGREKCKAHEEAVKAGTAEYVQHESGVGGHYRKIRSGTAEAFGEQSPLLDGTLP